MHLAQSRETKLRFLDIMKEEYADDLATNIANGKTGYFVGDNIDLTIRPKYQRMDNKNKSCHWYNTDFVIDRIQFDFEKSRNEQAMGGIEDVSPQLFCLTEEENEDVIMLYSYIIAWEAAKYLPAFKWMTKFLPRHLKHRFAAEMAKKSQVTMLPLLFKDEKNESDCVDILDATLGWIVEWHEKANSGIHLS